MPVYRLGKYAPHIDPSAFVAPSADIIGQVRLEAGTSVWFGAVLRGDIEPITVGAGSNVQDGAVLHTDKGHPCILESNVTVGHRATVHGAICEEGSLVGMGAVMLSGSRLGRGAVLAAGALLTEGQQVPDGMLAVGVPAKVVRTIAAQRNAGRYQDNARRYKQELVAQPNETQVPATPKP